jgi:MerR family transcriptional regulator, copper efflux regulator
MTTIYRIAEVADRSGFTPATLRYYEDIGLLAPASRTEAGYRLYDDASLQRLRFIARAKQLGCSLDEIAELATAWDGGQCVHVQDRLRATVAAKITASQRQIAELTSLTADLQRAAAALAANTVAGECDDTCGCLTDTVPAPATAVPLVAKAAAAAGSDSDPCAGGCGCAGDGAVTDEPAIVCTLDADRIGARIEDWSALLAGVGAGAGGVSAGVVARTAVEGGIRLEFGPGADVAEIARLAAAEQDCCRFFGFDLSIDARGVALEVRTPVEAAELVTAVFGAPA